LVELATGGVGLILDGATQNSTHEIAERAKLVNAMRESRSHISGVKGEAARLGLKRPP
jgi:hypothetical protein